MRKYIFNLLNFFWLTTATSLLYYLLVQDHTLHLSIPDIMNHASHSAKGEHICIIGLIPIYLGLIIFGAGLLFVYLRSNLWPILSHSFRQWLHIGRKS